MMKFATFTSSLFDGCITNSLGEKVLFNVPVGLNDKTNMRLASRLPDHWTFTVRSLHILCCIPTSFKFLVGCCSYYEFMLWGSTIIDRGAIILSPQQNFCWLVKPTSGELNNIFITMIGDLQRPVA